MKLASNVMASFLIFSLVIGLGSFIFSGLQDIYEFDEEAFGTDGRTMSEALKELSIIEGMEKFTTGIYELSTPESNLFDVLGALSASALGFIQMLSGIIIFVPEIFGLVTNFYEIPPLVEKVAFMLFTTYFAFIILYNRARLSN